MSVLKTPTAWAALLCASAGPVIAQAGVIDDSKATLTLRNYYFDRDYSDADAPQSQRQEWAQGFIFKATSGYTPGVVGAGLDVLGLVGVKLDSSPDRTGTELLPYDHDDGRAPGSYGRLGLTAKLRLSRSELRLGELLPDIPVLRFNDGRLLPQTFQGAMFTSREFEHLTLHAGRIHSFSPRSAADSEDLYPSMGGRTVATATSDRFTYAGGEYSLGKDSALGLWTAELQNVYHQDYYSITHYQPVGGWTVGGVLGAFDTRDTGRSVAGTLDNQAASLLLSAAHGGHRFYLGLQRMYGEDGWVTIDRSLGSTMANDLFANTFVSAQERSWQLRYDYNFAALGIPGLTMLMRYAHGDHIHTAETSNGREWERDLGLTYTFQLRQFQGLSVRWINAEVGRDFGVNDFTENRLIVSVPIELF
ncbi:Porin-like protein NicP precursor [compost metagenome]|uniref:OprD family porin n=1 Tax=Pseudomonas TaxID=286 RepID=UPI000414046F|nr:MULTISPECIES: OprD family porin [Pseudomonas]MCW2271967.1 porin-like protein GalP [Pseudomonas sp. JUb96]PRA63018.1 outer membrane porin, OprD family [Pseudomonas sp. MYb187]